MTFTRHGRWAVLQNNGDEWGYCTINGGYGDVTDTGAVTHPDRFRVADRHGDHRVYCVALGPEETATALRHGHLEPSALTPGRHAYLLPENGGAVVGLLVDGVFLVEPHEHTRESADA